MTRKEAMRLNHQDETLRAMGFTTSEAIALRRISMTLHRWHEHECNGSIQREGDDGTGKPFWYNSYTGRFEYPVADREKGAMKRLAAIMKGRTLTAYVQGDPRGVAHYILRPDDVPNGCDSGSYYSRGIAVY